MHDCVVKLGHCAFLEGFWWGSSAEKVHFRDAAQSELHESSLGGQAFVYESCEEVIVGVHNFVAFDRNFFKVHAVGYTKIFEESDVRAQWECH